MLGYTLGMKITVSVPDELFAQAEAEARRQGITRSALFQAALREYLKELDDAEITASYDRIAAKFDTSLDPVLAQMQLASLAKEDWV